MKPLIKHCIGLGLALLSSLALAIPAALVEEVSQATPGVRVLDYVSPGQVVDLGSNGRLTLGYLASCVHEQISGGRVTVGATESQVSNGKVERRKTPCDGTRLALAANQAMHSGAVAVRSMDPSAAPHVIVNDRSPLIFLPKAGRVVVKRLDLTGERHSIEVTKAIEGQLRIDLADNNIELAPGGIYMVTVAGLAQTFQVATGATRGHTPLVGRLVPF